MSFLSRLFHSTTLTPAAFMERRVAEAPVLDVRTAQEYASGHLAGAINVDVMAPDFLAKVDALGLDRDVPVYLYCRSGNRSGTAMQMLRTAGFVEACNVGGYEALKAAGAAVEE
jgi:rhodanese-related sulfurtransferase